MDTENSSEQEKQKALRIFVFDSPRTCSHLFRKLFLQHPQLGHLLEPYLVASVFGEEGSILRSTVDQLIADSMVTEANR